MEAKARRNGANLSVTITPEDGIDDMKCRGCNSVLRAFGLSCLALGKDWMQREVKTLDGKPVDTNVFQARGRCRPVVV